MRGRVVVARGVEEILKKLVANKMDDLEGDVHAELSGVATIECPQSLSLVHHFCTVQCTPIGCSIVL